MTDRLSSDHPSIETFRSTLRQRPTGVYIEIPTAETAADDPMTPGDANNGQPFPTDEVVRISLEESTHFARFERPLATTDRDDHVHLTGIYDTPGQARDSGSATNRLATWLDDADVRSGGSILIDVVESGFFYGIRLPGSQWYYDVPEPPSESLAAIAKNLEDR